MIQLQRRVPVKTFDVEATVAIGRDRPEFLAVARLAKDLNRSIGGRDVAGELLGGLSDHIGWRVIERCLALGLLERGVDRGPAQLSEAGEAALAYGAVLVPEEGTWRFFVAVDPLLPAAVIHVERLEDERARDERRDLRQHRNDGRGRPAAGERPPQDLISAQGVVLASITNGFPFELREIGGRGEVGPSGGLQLRLQWDAGHDPKVAVRGALPSDEGRKPTTVDQVVHPSQELADLSHEELWAALVERATAATADVLFEWLDRAGQLVLPTGFEDLTQAARRSFAQDLTIPDVDLEGLGRFQPSTLEGVHLVPRSPSDAQEWAEWLQWDGIEHHVVPHLLAEQGRAVLGSFPHHQPQMPLPSALLDRARQHPMDRTARFLLAPSDLGLWS